MTKIMMLSLMITACTEYPAGLWIGDNCTDEEIEYVHRAIDTLNEAVVEEIVFIAGIAKSPADPRNDDHYDMIHCYHDEDRWDVGNTRGYSSGGEIYIYSFRFWTTNDQWLATVLHELGHYLGAGHSNNPDDVMWPSGVTPPILAYTANDIAAITEGEAK